MVTLKVIVFKNLELLWCMLFYKKIMAIVTVFKTRLDTFCAK